MKARSVIMDNAGWPSLAPTSNSEVPVTGTTSIIHVLPTPAKKKFVRLGSLRQVRFELADIYRAARNGQIDASEATKLTYILQVIGNMIVEGQLESRVEILEKRK